jgi:hypothetical protein
LILDARVETRTLNELAFFGNWLDVVRKSISLFLLILWTLHVQSSFPMHPGSEFAKLVKHDHLKVEDAILGN